MTIVQEHYCVAVGMNDATGAFNNFGFSQATAQIRPTVFGD